VAEVYLPSVARLSVSDLLAAFEKGADRVLVVACHEGADRYPQATRRISRRVDQARQLLAEVGLDPDCLRMLELADENREAVHPALVAAAGTLPAG